MSAERDAVIMANKAKTVVIKLGTSMLTSGTRYLDSSRMIELVRAVKALRDAGHQVLVVSSGAIAAGREALGFPDVPRTVAHKQMLASVGQTSLMMRWQQLFAIYRISVGQVLLTQADLEERERFLNARDALEAIVGHHIVPIVNENDAVATREIKFGDNDNLSARVAVLADADMLILLTDQQGLFTADPRSCPDAKLIREVREITPEIHALAGDSKSGLGTGGMSTKIQAAEIAIRSGIEVIIASGDNPALIPDLVAGKGDCTRFCPETTPLEARKAWILAGQKPDGVITVDAGAENALRNRGASLLPSGITAVSGEFMRGADVIIASGDGREIARGLSRYDSRALDRIKRHGSDEIEGILGYENGSVAVHRDDMVLM